MVTHPGEYHWSSYAGNATGETNPLIQHRPVYILLGEKDYRRQFAYRELFRIKIGNDQIHSVRDALNQELALGRDDFKLKIEQMTKRHTHPANQAGLV